MITLKFVSSNDWVGAKRQIKQITRKNTEIYTIFEQNGRDMNNNNGNRDEYLSVARDRMRQGEKRKSTMGTGVSEWER